jgi:hypothetical protein
MFCGLAVQIWNMQRNSKKDENTCNIVKNCQKTTKIGNQALTNVPLEKKKTRPKNKKELLLCREPGGAIGKGVCAERGPSAQTCALSTAPAGSRQRSVNQGKPWSTPLPRAREGALRHSWDLCWRPDGGAVGPVDGSPNVTALAPSLTVHYVPRAGSRQRLDYAEGPSMPTARPSAKVAVSWVLMCRARLSATIFCSEGPRKSPRQRQKP